MEDEAVKQVLEYNPWWTDLYSEMMTSLEKGQEEENFAALGKKLKIRLIYALPFLNTQL